MRSRNSEKEQGKLALQIRISYLFLLIPILFLLGYVFYTLWEMNSRYDKMLNSVVTASEFSLDFKNDYDYETYLLIVGNKTPGQSLLPGLLTDARRVVNNLEQYTDTEDNRKRLSHRLPRSVFGKGKVWRVQPNIWTILKPTTPELFLIWKAKVATRRTWSFGKTMCKS